MAYFGTMVLTNQGIALQNKAQIGVELRFTRVAVGDGVLSGQNLEDLTALINEKMSLSINLLQIEEGLAILRVIFSNAGLTEGFYVRELGIFAQDPDVGEILYSVANAGSQADFLPPRGSNVVEEIFDVVTVIANATNVTATIDESLTFMTQLQLNSAILAAGWDYYGSADPTTVTGITVKPMFRWADSANKIIKIRNIFNTAWIDFMDMTTDKVLAGVIPSMIPPGAIMFFPRTSPPPGWLKATGALLSRTTYAALWAEAQASGVLVDEATWNSGYYGCYSTGDGSTTFRIPMIDGRTIVGAGQGIGLTNRPAGSTGGTETHTLTTAQLPVVEPHVHQETYIAGDRTIRDGWMSYELSGGSYWYGPIGVNTSNALSGTVVNTKPAGGFGGGQPHNNMQPYVALPAYIKY